MAIISNVGAGVIPILTTDTVVYDLFAPVERYCVTQCNAHNTTVAGITLEIYISPNLTSASGSVIYEKAISAGDSVDIDAILGLGTNQNVIAKASAVGINLTMTKIDYTEGD